MLDAKPFVEGVPLYRQVQSGIEDMIRANRRAKQMPLSDTQLAERFGVSRITVRRAVDELVDAGLLYRIQGRGTFVRQTKLKEKLTLNSFLDAWTQKAGRFTVHVAAFERVTSDSGLAERLSVREGVEVVYVRRLRFQKDTLVAIDDRYIPADYCPRLTTQDIRSSSLVDYLRNRERIELDHGEMEIEARRADRREAKDLGIQQGQPILVRRVTFLTKKNQPILTGTSIYRADRVSYRLTVSA
jgi:GntR family transcriptional regulator, N-acetylglucosamine utilization regulator